MLERDFSKVVFEFNRPFRQGLLNSAFFDWKYASAFLAGNLPNAYEVGSLEPEPLQPCPGKFHRERALGTMVGVWVRHGSCPTDRVVAFSPFEGSERADSTKFQWERI